VREEGRGEGWLQREEGLMRSGCSDVLPMLIGSGSAFDGVSDVESIEFGLVVTPDLLQSIDCNKYTPLIHRKKKYKNHVNCICRSSTCPLSNFSCCLCFTVNDIMILISMKLLCKNKKIKKKF
jgi:hypothetical protein